MNNHEPNLIVCGTGHRPDAIGGYTQEIDRKLFEIACKALEKKKPNKVISGMALGWDQALAVASIALNIPFVAAVPFEGFELKWTEKAKRKYRNILFGAEKVVYVCSAGYHPSKMQERNKWMVNNSDLLLAFWNGTEHGGAYNTIKYARQLDFPMVNYWEHFNKG